MRTKSTRGMADGPVYRYCSLLARAATPDEDTEPNHGETDSEGCGFRRLCRIGAKSSSRAQSRPEDLAVIELNPTRSTVVAIGIGMKNEGEDRKTILRSGEIRVGQLTGGHSESEGG